MAGVEQEGRRRGGEQEVWGEGEELELGSCSREQEGPAPREEECGEEEVVEWWRKRHHDLSLAHLVLGLVHLCQLILPLLLPSTVTSLLPPTHPLLQLFPLLSLPATLSSLSASLRRQAAPLVTLQLVLVLCCLLPTLLSLLLLLPALLHPPTSGQQALLLGLPLPLAYAALHLLSTLLNTAQMVTARRLMAAWQGGKEE